MPVQDALRQNSVEIDSVSLLSADLAAPDAAGSSSGPNIGVIVGGIAGAVCGIAIIIVAVLLFMRLKRRHKNAVPKAAVQPEPEFKAKPFYEAYSKGPEPDMTDIEADAVSGTAQDLIPLGPYGMLLLHVVGVQACNHRQTRCLEKFM